MSLDESLRGLRNRAMLLVGYDTLCRRSELVSLRVEDISVQLLDRKNKIISTVIFLRQARRIRSCMVAGSLSVRNPPSP